MIPVPSYSITPLGDSALLVDFGNKMDEDINQIVISLFHQITDQGWEGCIEAIPAYSSLAILYDPYVLRHRFPSHTSIFDGLKEKIRSWIPERVNLNSTTGRKIKIPVCYDPVYGKDIHHVGRHLQLTADEIVSIHTSVSYSVYMLGFLPGFAYMGKLPDPLIMPRKNVPEMVVQGSVGLAGNQTGIYPLNAPGGWQIIGKTPVHMFNKNEKKPVYLQPGDQITFYPITADEFENY